ncbi:MAG: helix-turn-helix domain-containing protein [Patescibacteria group bacterium]
MQVDAKKLGQNIKKLRFRLGISQETLARRADLKLSNVAKLEGGFNFNPTLATLIAIAKIIADGSIDRLLR